MRYKVGDIVRIRDDLFYGQEIMSENGVHKTVIGTGKIKCAGYLARITDVDEYHMKYTVQLLDERGFEINPFDFSSSFVWVADSFWDHREGKFDESEFAVEFLLGGD